jgi:DNA repair protein RecN (Recombination protein N)
MLKSLRIRNYALIDDLAVDFEPGLNVLTGETGAGKSIIIGAFSLLLGEKADADVIRAGRDSAVVEGEFELPAAGSTAQTAGRTVLTAILTELALDQPQDETVVIRRKVAGNGKSTALVNDHPVSNATLKRLGDVLVDLHGQHEHQSLLNRDLHLRVLDDFAGLISDQERVAELWFGCRAQQQELAARQEELQAKRARRDLTEFQFKELVAARLAPDEIAALSDERVLVESAEKRLTLVRELLAVLAEEEGAVQEQLSGAERRLEALAGLDERLATANADLKQAVAILDELWRNLVKYRDTVETTPGRLDEINERLFALERLVRKVHPQAGAIEKSAIEDLIGRRDQLGQELASLEVDETKIPVLEQELAQTRTKLTKAARELSRSRKQAATKLEAKLSREFAGLGLARAKLLVQIERREETDGLLAEGGKHYRVSESGADEVEFLFSANPGEEPRPLRKIASGGELSRIMLALKSVLAAGAQVPVMVFDEIDVGIGGRIADAVGRKLSRIADGRQVICITHLPQIARFAASHFLVSKSVQSERTVTRLSRLDPGARIEEIARMLAGAEITSAARTHAREMLNNVQPETIE